jgi:hypothetical protein
MDLVEIDVSVDGSDGSWIPIFYYGGSLYYNSSIAGYSEGDNTPILIGSLLGSPVRTGIGIDIDRRGLSGSYRYLQIISPSDSDGGCDVDAIQVIP